MSSTLAIFAQTAFDPTLTLGIPDPVVGADKVLYRFAAEAIPALGPLSAWTADLGAKKVLTQNTAQAQPTVATAGGWQHVNFDGGDSLVSTQVALAKSLSAYFVVQPTARTPLSVIANFGGMFVALNANGQVRVGGTNGSVQSAPSIPLGTWAAIGVTVAPVPDSATSVVSITLGAETIAAPPITVGNLTALDLGASGASYFTGNLRQALVMSETHTPSQVAATIADLKNRYGIA